MQLLNMERTDDYTLDWVVALETQDEQAVYDATHTMFTPEEEAFWDYYLEAHTGKKDIDIAHYIMANEEYPDIGCNYTSDEHTWIRTIEED